MQIGHYTADVELEPEERRFRGRVSMPRPDGTVDAFDFVGATYDELEREFQVSAFEYERACRENGREPART